MGRVCDALPPTAEAKHVDCDEKRERIRLLDVPRRRCEDQANLSTVRVVQDTRRDQGKHYITHSWSINASAMGASEYQTAQKAFVTFQSVIGSRAVGKRVSFTKRTRTVCVSTLLLLEKSVIYFLQGILLNRN